MLLPAAFCWSKFGTEAGEAASSIVDRKDRERELNEGVFLWGIGSSIRPSLSLLLDLVDDPEVVFTPMLSAPATRDVRPGIVGRWNSAVGIDGSDFRIPEYSLVTSGSPSGTTPRRHYALVCERSEPLQIAPDEGWLDDDAVRNLRSGSRVGSSQVTSVVRSDTRRSERRRYRIAFRARLRPPYLLQLGHWSPIEAVPPA